MAKGNMLLGQARGKVGDIVFSRNNGQQVIKARSEQVKNPQTTAQVLQRILLNTISQAYSKMLSICDHSFEGVKTGQDTMSAFMKRNLNQIRNRVVTLKNQTGSLSGFYAVTPIGQKTLSINPYIMATGTLPPVAVSSLSGTTAADSVAVVNIPGLAGDVTYANVISGLGLRRGDQLTFITLNYDAAQGVQFNYARVILDPMNEDGTPADLGSALTAGGVVLMPSDRNDGTFARLTAANGAINFAVGGGIVVGACVIVSRQADNGDWMRSNAVMQIPADITGYGQVSLLDAIDLFYSGGLDLESAYYLNNAERASGGSSSSTSGGGSEEQPTEEISALTSLTIDGSNIFGDTAAVSLTAGSEDGYDVAGQIDDFNAAQNPKVVFSTLNLTVGSLYSQQSGEKVVACNSANFSDNINITESEELRAYFVAGGYIRRKCGTVTLSAGPHD